MSTFEGLSKKVAETHDEIEEFHVVPMHNFITEVQLAKKKKDAPRMVRVTLPLHADEMFEDPEDVGSNFAAVPLVGFMKLKKDN